MLSSNMGTKTKGPLPEAPQEHILQGKNFGSEG